MHRVLRFLQLTCGFIDLSISSSHLAAHGDKPAAVVEVNTRKFMNERANLYAEAWWKFMDADCDDMIGEGEAVNGTARILGQDPLHFQKSWDSWSDCGGGRPSPHFLFHMTSEFLISLGRADRTPCTVQNMYRSTTKRYLKGHVERDLFKKFVSLWLKNYIKIEAIMFEEFIDTNHDDCLSEEEWTAYVERITTIYGLPRSQTVMIPEFSTIANYQPPPFVVIGVEHIYAWSCVTGLRFGVWSLFLFIEGFPAVNQTAPCFAKVNQTHTAIELSDQQEPEVSTSILGWILGGCGLACLGICGMCTGLWYSGKRHHKHHQMEKLMSARVYAWSVFDSNLTAMVSSLSSSFMDYLGISDLQQDQLSLLQLVHPEDRPLVHSALTEIKEPTRCKSVPISREVRLQHGNPFTHQEDDLQEDVKYINVMLFMAWSSKSTIHVGLTRLDTNRSWKPMPADCAIFQEIHSQNGAAVTWESIMTENQKFIDARDALPVVLGSNSELRHIAAMGIEEHWIIPREHITHQSGVLSTGGFGKLQRGLLFGSSEVVVKTALEDERQEALAAKCNVLANEARLLKRIRHPNIVLFHGVICTPGPHDTVQLGIVLEWVIGGNFEQYCKNCHTIGAYESKLPKDADKKLKVITDCGLLVDIIRGMVYLHASTPIILHRDLKPANVLVDTKCAPPIAKLTDFGLSIVIEQDIHIRSRTGTKSYMAPEVRKGEPHSTMVDVFSFGCIMLFFLTGHHPPKDVNALSLAQGLCCTEPFMESLATIACSCLNYDPLIRPSFADLFEVLSTAIVRARHAQKECHSQPCLQGVSAGNVRRSL